MDWEKRPFGLFILLFLMISKSAFTQKNSMGGGIPPGVQNPSLSGAGGNFQQQQNIGSNDNPNVFTGTGNNLFYGG